MIDDMDRKLNDWETWRFTVTNDWNSFDSFHIRGAVVGATGNIGVLKYAYPEPIERGAEIPPFLTLKAPQIQKLMDALWIAGIRPTEGHGSTGQLAATEKHLDDMRKLVFKAAEIKA